MCTISYKPSLSRMTIFWRSLATPWVMYVTKQRESCLLYISRREEHECRMLLARRKHHDLIRSSILVMKLREKRASRGGVGKVILCQYLSAAKSLHNLLKARQLWFRVSAILLLLLSSQVGLRRHSLGQVIRAVLELCLG